jgi:hypothetical protein
MIAKINQLKSQIEIAEVKTLCESTLSAISSAIYNGVTTNAKLEIERIALENLFIGLAKFPNDKIVSEWLSNQKRIYSVKNLGVRKAVDTLIEKESKYDDALAIILEDFRSKLDGDIPEVLLYEGFISAMSGYTFLPAVTTELDAVVNRVKQYKNDVDISKIIEVMKGTRSNYLIPLIEDVVDKYLTNKTELTKHILKETLMKFSYDEFIRDIITIVSLDAAQLQLEYANAECDIDDDLFSPIMYLGENEILFNVKGTYYVKKGNNINKLKKDEVNNLNENFKNFCEILNFNGIEVSKRDIKVYVGEDNAVLTETNTLVNGKPFNKNQLNESTTIAEWSGKTDFFNIVNTLRENFNEIAEIDFAKRVYLKENENYAADIFKLRDNIFITTFDPINNKSTFYRNINPIQAEKIMMEHMRFDVSRTFEDILPNKEKILSEIDSTKQEYSNYISELENRIDKFDNSYRKDETVKSVIEALQEELDEVKNDYKNYLNEVEQYVSVVENLNITVQDDQSGKSYTVVVPTGAMASKGEGGGDVGSEGGKESDEFGTKVGMGSLPSGSGGDSGAASAVTFDDDKSELISDEPSDEKDKVDLGADELEAYADVVDAEKELEKPEGEEEAGVNGGVNAGTDAGAEGGDNREETSPESPEKSPEDELELGDTGDEENTAELNINSPEEKGKNPDEEESDEEKKKKEESVVPPTRNLERTNFNKDKNPDDISEVPKTRKKVFLKRPKKTTK